MHHYVTERTSSGNTCCKFIFFSTNLDIGNTCCKFIFSTNLNIGKRDEFVFFQFLTKNRCFYIFCSYKQQTVDFSVFRQYNNVMNLTFLKYQLEGFEIFFTQLVLRRHIKKFVELGSNSVKWHVFLKEVNIKRS